MVLLGFSGNKKQAVSYIALFIVVLLLSIVWQLPANWVLAKPAVKQAIEKKLNTTQQLKILASRGTIWQGEVDLAIENKATHQNNSANSIALGKVTWDLHLLSLLATKLSANIHWKLGLSKLSGEVSTGLLASTDTQKIQLSDVNGVVNLKDLMAKLPLQNLTESAVSQNLSGLVSVNYLQADYLVEDKWFTLFQTDIQVDDLLIMNNAFPTLTLKSELQKEDIQTALHGQQAAWNLSGVASLNKNYAYHLDLNLKAASDANLPDWAFVMNKKSAGNYSTKLQGRLF